MTSAYYDWTHRENKIYVKDVSTTDGVQAYVQLPLLHGMNNDGSDIRFSDTDGNIVPYWIAEFSNNLFTIWVKLPASAFIIYFYYGNPLATSESNGKAVFELFDEFSAATLDTDIWQGGAGYSIVDGQLVLTGTADNRAWISSKNSFSAPYIMSFQGTIVSKSNNINLGSHIHASSNTDWVGNGVNGYICSDMDDNNGIGLMMWRITGGTTYTQASNTAFSETLGRQYFVQITAKTDGIEQIVSTDDGFTLQTGTTTDTTFTSGYVGFDVQNTGVSIYNRVTIRKYVATPPELVVVYDLEKLDPISIDVTKSTTSVYQQLTAKFPHNLLPPEQSRIIYFANGSDVTNYLLFYGRIQTLSKTVGHKNITVDMTATDDIKSLSDQKVQWVFTKTEVADDPEGWVYNMCVNTDVSLGFYSETPYALQSFIFEPNTTKLELLQKVIDYHLFMIKPYYVIDEAAGVMPNEAISVILPADLDADPRYSPPAPIEFEYPYPTLADNLTIERKVDDRYSKVLCKGISSATGLQVASIAITKNIQGGTETSKDFVITDNYLAERSDTAEQAAVRGLLYFQTERATVKFKLMDTVGIELYQRVRFGQTFPDELYKLTNQTQFEYVYACDPNTNPGDLLGNYHMVDVSLVPRPSWLRVTGIHFFKDAKTKYLEVEAITDWIISSIDPEVPVPYNRYGNGGMTKPTISDTTTMINKQIQKIVSKRAVPEYGTVQASPAPTATLATFITDSGKTIVAKTKTTLVAGTKYLIVPDTINGTYYVSS